MRRGAWNNYSRYRAVRRGRLWSVEAENGEMLRMYPAHRYDRAQAFADKLNSEEWMQAYFAKRPKVKKKLKKVA
jgi:hypothetical protein